MFLTDGRKVELMLRIVRLDQIVGNLVGKGEKPDGNRKSAHGREPRSKNTTHQDTYAAFVSPLSTSASSENGQVSAPQLVKLANAPTPSLEVPQIQEDTSVAVECYQSSRKVIEDMQTRKRKLVYTG